MPAANASKMKGRSWGLVDLGLVDWGLVDWCLVDWGLVDWGLVHWGLVDWGLVHWGRLGSLDVGASLPGCLLLDQDGGGLGDVAPMLSALAGHDDLGRDSALLY